MIEPATQPISLRRVLRRVDAGAISANTRLFRSIVGANCQVMGVVKANAYGHGAVPAAQAMLDGGATQLGVATIGEGLQLRVAGVNVPVLVLGAILGDEIAQALAYDLALAIGDHATLEQVAATARSMGRVARCQLQIDTGMHRLGLLPHEVLPLLDAPAARTIDWAGIFTHFACADEPWRPETHAQIACFDTLVGALRAAGWRFPVMHAARSAGALAFPTARYDLVRPGIALFGVAPSADLPLPAGFQPALTCSTPIVRIATLPAGSAVSYGGSYVTPGPRRIATLAAGYADGLRRAPAWRAVLIGGQRASIIGRICMDAAMADISAIPDVHVGDEAVLLGNQGAASIRADEAAAWLGISAYEVLTSLG